MQYDELMETFAKDPEQLERLYREAAESGESGAFQSAIERQRAAAPGNMLYDAWHYRLSWAAGQTRAAFTNWGWAIPPAIINGLLLWFFSDDARFGVPIARGATGGFAESYFPVIFLLVAPISAGLIMVYLTGAGRRGWKPAGFISLGLLAAVAYVMLAYPRMGTRLYQEQYLTLMAMHLPLLAWAGMGLFTLQGRRGDRERFAFLIKSLELFVSGGLFVIAGGLFVAITVGLFEAIDVTMPDTVQRLLLAGGAGLLPVIATAIIYNPGLPPSEQAFDEGLSKLLAMLTRIMLPLAVLVLLIYLAFIPFNFFKPFENRDVLIVYNGMLFAVIGLTLGATPIKPAAMPGGDGRWLRRGIVALAALAAIVSLYALAAILYRTAIDRLTPNRLAFIGWNAINIGLLLLILLLQARDRGGRWLGELQRAFAKGAVVYAVWTLVMIVALPWLFGVNQTRVEGLPPAVQRIVYDEPPPILLKCRQSPHIYLLEDGQKRWIDTIDTFTARGYVWRDVSFITCDDLRMIPDGIPIPEDAGPPPQP